MNPPIAFISYSHDSAQHKAWVQKLATELRGMGIDAILDVWDFRLGQDASEFMQQGISRSDRVLMICTEKYVAKANQGKGGVAYEKLIVSAELVHAIDTIKFIPVIRDQPAIVTIPTFMGDRKYADFRDDMEYAAKLTELGREIYGLSDKPPLGKNPFGL